MLRHPTAPVRAVTAAVVALVTLAGCATGVGSADAPDVPPTSSATRAAYEPTEPTEPTATEVTEPTEPPTATPGLDVYVAMGDSYTAAPLDPLDDDLVIDDCLRSTSNYPTLVADGLGIDVTDVSCSGASTVSILNNQRFTSTVMPPQLDALSPDADLVTLGIGANDFTFFSEMIFDCLDLADRDVRGAPCQESNMTSDGRDRLRLNLHRIRKNVRTVVAAIADRAPDARILLVGYPQIIPSTGTCRARLPLAIGDYAYTLDLNLRLAKAVRRGGISAGAEYVDLVAASKGHDICAEQPWVAGIRGKDNKAAGLHPYPLEQEAVARLVLDRL